MSRVELNNNKISVNDNHSWTCYVNEGSNFMLSAYYGYGNADITIIPTPNTENVYGSVTFVFNIRPCQVTETIVISGVTAPMLIVEPEEIHFTRQGQSVDIVIVSSSEVTTTNNSSDYDIMKKEQKDQQYIYTVTSISNNTYSDSVITFTNTEGFATQVLVSQTSDENDIMSMFEVTPTIVNLQDNETSFRLYVTSIIDGELAEYSISGNVLDMKPITTSAKYVDFNIPSGLTADTTYILKISRGDVSKETKVYYNYNEPKQIYLAWCGYSAKTLTYQFKQISGVGQSFSSSSRCNIIQQSNKASAIIQFISGDTYNLCVTPKDFHEITSGNAETIIISNQDGLRLTFTYTITSGLISDIDYKFELSSLNKTLVQTLTIEDAYNTCMPYNLTSKERDVEEEWYLRSLNYVQYILKQYDGSKWEKVDNGSGSSVVYIGGSDNHTPQSHKKGDYWIYSDTLNEVYEDLEAHFRLEQNESFKEIDVTCKYEVMVDAELSGIEMVCSPTSLGENGGVVNINVKAKYTDNKLVSIDENEDLILTTYNGNAPIYVESATTYEWAIDPTPNVSDTVHNIIASYQGFTTSSSITQNAKNLGDDKYYVIFKDHTGQELNLDEHQLIPWDGENYTFTVILDSPKSGQLNITNDAQITVNNEAISNGTWAVLENDDINEKEYTISVIYNNATVASISASQETPYSLSTMKLYWKDGNILSETTLYNSGNTQEYELVTQAIYSHKYDITKMKLIDGINEQCLFVNKSHPLSDNGVNRNQVINFNRWVLGDNDTLEIITHTVSASYNGCQSNTLTAEQASPYSPYDIALIMDANGQTFDYTTRECPFVVNLIYAHHDNSDRTKVVENINTSPLLTYGIESTSYNIISSVKSDKTALVLPENTLWDTVTHTLRVSYQNTNGHIFAKTVQVSQTSPYTLDGITLKFAYDVSFISYVGVSQTIKVTAQYKHVDGTIKDFPTDINQHCDFVPSESTTCDKSNWKFPKNMDMEEKTHTLKATYQGKESVLTVTQQHPYILGDIKMSFVDHANKSIEVANTSGEVKYNVSSIYVNQLNTAITSSFTITNDCSYETTNNLSSVKRIDDSTYMWSYQANEESIEVVHKLKATYEGKFDELSITQQGGDGRNYDSEIAFYSLSESITDLTMYVDFVAVVNGEEKTTSERKIEGVTLSPYSWNSSNMPHYITGFGTRFTDGTKIADYWDKGFIRVSIPTHEGMKFEAMRMAFNGSSPLVVATSAIQTDYSETVERAEFPTTLMSAGYGITTYEEFVDKLMEDRHGMGCDMPIAFIIDYAPRTIQVSFRMENQSSIGSATLTAGASVDLKFTDGSSANLNLNVREQQTLEIQGMYTTSYTLQTSGMTMGNVGTLVVTCGCGTITGGISKADVHIAFESDDTILATQDWTDNFSLQGYTGSIDQFNLGDVTEIFISFIFK